MTARPTPGLSVTLAASGIPGTVRAVLRNGRFLVAFSGGYSAWFSPWEKGRLTVSVT